MTQRASVDFPHPVSPTRASVSPRRTSRLTSLTACTFSRDRAKRPPLFTGNSFTTCSSETSGSPGRAETCAARQALPALRAQPARGQVVQRRRAAASSGGVS